MLHESPVAAVSALERAFKRALPSPGWMDMGDGGAWVALFDVAHWSAWLPQAGSLLDEAERSRVARRRRECDRDNLTLAYALHRLFLAEALGMDPASVPVGRDEQGCPRLRGSSISTSLSHSERYLAIALATCGPIGVDIEPCSRTGGMEEIISQVCHPSEMTYMEKERLRGQAGQRWLLSLWVRKEAFLKAAGVGLAREMHTFPAPEGVDLSLEQADRRLVRLHMLDAGAAAVAAAAIPPGAVLRVAWLQGDAGSPRTPS